MRLINSDQTEQDAERERISGRRVAAIWLVFYQLVGAYTAASILVSTAMLANIKF
jgi:hypothetical protein